MGGRGGAGVVLGGLARDDVVRLRTAVESEVEDDRDRGVVQPLHVVEVGPVDELAHQQGRRPRRTHFTYDLFGIAFRGKDESPDIVMRAIACHARRCWWARLQPA